MIKCFGPVWSGPVQVEYNRVGLGLGHYKNLLFSGSEQVSAKYYPALWGQGAKNLAPLDSTVE